MTWQRVYVPEPAVRLPVFLFDKQREQCEQCAHVEIRPDAAIGVTLVGCLLARGIGGRSGKVYPSPCSAARLPGAPCGPEAKLFKRR